MGEEELLCGKVDQSHTLLPLQLAENSVQWLLKSFIITILADTVTSWGSDCAATMNPTRDDSHIHLG